MFSFSFFYMTKQFTRRMWRRSAQWVVLLALFLHRNTRQLSQSALQ